MKRIATIKRTTKETEITIKLNIDGSGKYKISTGIGFLDHMLELFAKHGLFDLEIKAKGDLKVDIHHTNEDVGISLGEAFKKALGDKKGIKRYGRERVPMDEALVEVSIDLSGRPSFVDATVGDTAYKNAETREYSFQDALEFLKAFTNNLGFNLIFTVKSPRGDLHHILESLFKSLARAMDEATQIDPRVKGIPSTKGKL
jgi:imidazoleglycerol-phosphate dehydratase